MEDSQDLESFISSMVGYLEVAQREGDTVEDVVRNWNEKLDEYLDVKAGLKVEEVL